MAHQLNRLTARAVATATKPGLYADGGGLYLRVARGGAKSWALRYMLSGKAREMGLGGISKVALADARRKAAAHRLLLADKVDPITVRAAERSGQKAEAVRAMTFSACAEGYIRAHRASWRNAKHAAQWQATLATYAEPMIGALPVQAIDTALVMKVLEQQVEVKGAWDAPAAPLWNARPETASRLRGRIEAILDWARVRGYREGANPAGWRGHLDHLLPPRSKVRAVVHHAALPYLQVPAFIAELREQTGTSARCLELTILAACRTAEAIAATWAEFDLDTAVWTIPAGRMKAAREHRIALSKAAVAVLREMLFVRQNEFVFPAGNQRGRHLSNMAMLVLLGRMGHGELTVHGFRSSFRTWAAEQTNFPREVIEAALAHVIGDKTEAAYQRGDLFSKRRRLMDAWASFCARPAAGSVTPIRRSV